MRFLLTLLAFVPLLPSVVAHYTFMDFIFPNGTKSGPFTYIRRHTNGQEPLFDVYSQDIRCNIGGLSTGRTTQVAILQAGDRMGMSFDTALFHIGPLLVYMSKAPDNVQEYDGSGEWFKINEVGPMFTENQKPYWPTREFYEYSWHIPSETPPGQYLVRLEHIAVHYANEFRGSQLYVSCAQVEVTGNGKGTPGPVVKIPGVYSPTDPGIYFEPYQPPIKNYTMPGPIVWKG